MCQKVMYLLQIMTVSINNKKYNFYGNLLKTQGTVDEFCYMALLGAISTFYVGLLQYTKK